MKYARVSGSAKPDLIVPVAVPCSLRGKIWKAIAELEPFDAKFSYVDMLVEPCIYLHAIMIDIGNESSFMPAH